VPPLLFVDVDNTQRPGSEALLGSLHRHGRLDQLILEEAHLLLTTSHYWERLPLIAQLRRYSCRLLCRIGVERTAELHHAKCLEGQLGPAEPADAQKLLLDGALGVDQ
jgi:hypothetical protein